MPLLCAIAIVRPEMKVIRGDSSVLLPGSSLHSARASKNYNLILFRTILHPPDSFVSKNEGMAEGADIYFGDAAHIRSDHHAGRTWAKKGETPIVVTTGARYAMSLISAITSKGRMRFMIKATGGVNADVFIE